MATEIRTLEQIEEELNRISPEEAALRTQVEQQERKLSELRQRRGEAGRALATGQTADVGKIARQIETLEAHLEGLRSMLAEKEGAIEQLEGLRQPLALQKAREMDMVGLRKLEIEVNEKRALWLKAVEDARAAEAAFYEAQQRHRLEADRISDTWSKLKVGAVA
jgi:predicted RNase H-like nuclease (RuvC/YqgF family)